MKLPYVYIIAAEVEAFFTVNEQTLLFLLSVALGAGLGIVYDMFRAVRAVLPFMKATAPTVVCDILFCLIAGVVIYLFSLIFARGEVRFYYALGAGLGMTIYLFTAGSVVIGIIRFVFGGIYSFLRKVYKLISVQCVKTHKKINTKSEA